MYISRCADWRRRMMLKENFTRVGTLVHKENFNVDRRSCDTRYMVMVASYWVLVAHYSLLVTLCGFQVAG